MSDRPASLGGLLDAPRRRPTRAQAFVERRTKARAAKRERAGLIERGAQPPSALHRRVYPVCARLSQERYLVLAVLLTLSTCETWGMASLAWIALWVAALFYVLVCANPDGGRLPHDPAPYVPPVVPTRAPGSLLDVVGRRRP